MGIVFYYAAQFLCSTKSPFYPEHLTFKAMKKTTFLLWFIFFFAFGTLRANTIYVNRSLSTGSDNGTSWANAYRGGTALQKALNTSSAATNDEIWVAAGTYVPSAYPAGCTTCTIISNFSFSLKNGVKLYGGVVGTETTLSQRNFRTNETVLSGFNNPVYSYHVVLAVNVNSSAVLDGFTIRDGRANTASTISVDGISVDNSYGSGMANYASDPTVSNCIIISNQASSGGGGFDNYNSSPTVSNCAFISNSGANGGGMNNYNSSPQIRDCLFVSNSATNGGGFYNEQNSQPTIINTTVFGNTGGAMYNSDSTPTITNSIIWGNSSAMNATTVTMSATIIQGGYTPCTNCPNGDGNISPQFVNSADPNGADDKWGTPDDGLQLADCSPAVDKAKLSSPILHSDIAGQSRGHDVPFRSNATGCLILCTNYIDLGAYENQRTDYPSVKIYVNGSLASGANNGTSWVNAFRGSSALQNALAAASCGENEIWVAAGTYKPSAYPPGCTGCVANRDYTFHLKDGVKMYGGFAGVETSVNQRNVSNNETILSGDVNNTIDNSDDNVYHILLSLNDDAYTELNGFTIRDGGDRTSYYPTFPTTTVEGYAMRINNGGGVYNYNTNTRFANCSFIFNKPYSGTMYNDYSNVLVENCNFIENRGSGIVNNYSNSTIQNCAFFSNSANQGGGISNLFSSPSIGNCTFASNVGANGGGGIHSNNNCFPTITNCSFASNVSANEGGGISTVYYSASTIVNCIIWGNTAVTGQGVFNDASSSSTISHSIVQGGYSPCSDCPNTNGNINPQFVNIADADGPDDKPRTPDDGLAILRTSPAINTGSNTGTYYDILNNNSEGNRDIGAYEVMPKNKCVNKHIADVPIEAGTHVSPQTITANGTVGTGTSVVFEAGKSITFLPGFKTGNTAVFRAQIASCDSVE